MIRAAQRITLKSHLHPCYNVSELAISRLRMIAQQELGTELFDLNSFHGCLIESDSMPLDTLELKVNQWIERTKAQRIFPDVTPQCP